MRTNAENLLGSLIGKAPWSVWNGMSSVLVFEFGRKRRGMIGSEGTFSLWVDMANWVIRKRGKETASSDCSRDKIVSAARNLERKKLTGITLKKYIDKKRNVFGVLLRFADRNALDAIMLLDKKTSTDVILKLYTPTQILQFTSDGELTLKKLKQEKVTPRVLVRIRKAGR